MIEPILLLLILALLLLLIVKQDQRVYYIDGDLKNIRTNQSWLEGQLLRHIILDHRDDTDGDEDIGYYEI